MKAKLDFGGQVVEVELRAMSEKPEFAQHILVFTFDKYHTMHNTPKHRVWSYQNWNNDAWNSKIDNSEYIGWIPEPIITVEDV